MIAENDEKRSVKAKAAKTVRRKEPQTRFAAAIAAAAAAAAESSEGVVPMYVRRRQAPAPDVGTAPRQESSGLRMNLVRLSVVATLGIAIGYLLSPISPFAWARSWGLLAFCAIPLSGLVYSLARAARG